MSRVLFYIRRAFSLTLVGLGLVVFVILCIEFYKWTNLDLLALAYSAICVSAIGVGLWLWERSRRPLGWALVALSAGLQIVCVILLLISPNPFSDIAFAFTAPALAVCGGVAAVGGWLLWRPDRKRDSLGTSTSKAPAAERVEQLQLALNLPTPQPITSSRGLWIKRGGLAAASLALLGGLAMLFNAGPSESERKLALELELINQISGVASKSLAELGKAMADLQGVSRDDPTVLAKAMLNQCQQVLDVVKNYSERQVRMLEQLQQHTDKEFANAIRAAVQSPNGDGRTMRISESLHAHWKQTAVEVDKQMNAARSHCTELLKTIQRWR